MKTLQPVSQVILVIEAAWGRKWQFFIITLEIIRLSFATAFQFWTGAFCGSQLGNFQSGAKVAIGIAFPIYHGARVPKLTEVAKIQVIPAEENTRAW